MLALAGDYRFRSRLQFATSLLHIWGTADVYETCGTKSSLCEVHWLSAVVLVLVLLQVLWDLVDLLLSESGLWSTTVSVSDRCLIDPALA